MVISILNIVVTEAIVTVAVIVKLPDEEKICVGFSRVEALLTPVEGSPKSQITLSIGVVEYKLN